MGLWHRVVVDGATAAVVASDDPGTFYCAGLARELARYNAARPATVTGFMHMPADQATGPVAAANPALLTRRENHALAARVLGRFVAAIAGDAGEQVVMLTGFGAFEHVADNPTRAFVETLAGEANAASLDAVVRQAFGRTFEREPMAARDGRVTAYRYRLDGHAVVLATGVFALAETEELAVAGRHTATMADLRARLADLLADVAHATGGRTPDAIIGLGVDSKQAANGPKDHRFKLETRSLGFMSRIYDPAAGELVAHVDADAGEPAVVNDALVALYVSALAGSNRRGST